MQQPIPECPSQPLDIHEITLKGKQDKNWGQLFALMISQWNNLAEFMVDVYPRQEGLLSFNSDYMVWYRQKTKMSWACRLQVGLLSFILDKRAY